LLGWLVGFFGGRSGLLIFSGFDLRVVFRRENLRVLQILFGVNVLGFFLQGFFAYAFLAGGFGDVLVSGL
jgi:hypothetical protein